MVEIYNEGRGRFQPRGIDLVTLESVRARANQVVFRALSDEQFRERLKGNPEKTLDEAGLGAGPSEDILREVRIDGLRLVNDCTLTCWWTCIFSMW